MHVQAGNCKHDRLEVYLSLVNPLISDHACISSDLIIYLHVLMDGCIDLPEVIAYILRFKQCS